MPYRMVFSPLQVNNKLLMAEKTRIRAHRLAYRNYDDDSHSVNDPVIDREGLITAIFQAFQLSVFRLLTCRTVGV